ASREVCSLPLLHCWRMDWSAPDRLVPVVRLPSHCLCATVAWGGLARDTGERCAWGWWRQQAPGSIARDRYGRARGRGERYRQASGGEFSGTSVSPLPRGTPGERGAMSLRVVDSEGEGREPNRD
ncbi:unnamed protein product, partial [Ectocarpus sp. 12 AP-2014]